MKIVKSFALCVLCAISSLHASEMQVQSLYQEGLRAMTQGKVELAETKFAKVLQLAPRHADARYQLLKIRGAGKDSVVARAKESRLKRIKIERIDFENATLDDALDYLAKELEKAGEATNFVVRDSSGALNEKRISLKLKKVPASTALNYIARAAGAEVAYARHAIEISPASR